MFAPRSLAALALALGVTAVAAPAEASCGSPSGCARYVTCPGGFAMKPSGGEVLCVKSSSTKTKTPSCGRLNSRNDWKWSSDNKKCYRRKATGIIVFATKNIECPGGYHYKSGSGKCVDEGGMTYARAVVSKTDPAPVAPRTCSSAHGCQLRITCPSSHSLKSIGKKKYCTFAVPERVAEPRCKRLRNRSDWTWDAKARKCTRTRKNGQEVRATKNIACPTSDFSYVASRGECVAKPETRFATPSLK